jgi:hypothetical protein
MKFSAKAAWTGIVAVSMAFTLWGSAQAQTAASSVQGALTRNSTVLRGTPAYENIRQFIVGSTNKEVHASLDDPRSSPAWFVVKSTSQFKSAADIARAQDAPGPPVSLPGGAHNPGDTITVSSCSGGSGSAFLQTWGYTWSPTGAGEGGGWVLTTYHMDRVMNCPVPKP